MNKTKASYTVLDHTADLKLRGEGENFPATLGNVARGLFSILFETAPGGSVEHRRVEVSGYDRPSLVVNFLNELLYVVEEEQVCPINVHIHEVNDEKLLATLEFQGAGEPPAYDIKAATYHELVAEDQVIEVVFDL